MNSKQNKFYTILALTTLALLVVGTTYAYFQNQYGSASNADVNVTTYTTDMLTFETGDAINITADQNTFAEGKGNATSSTFARATLQANNKTNTATANYYVYLNISGNDFEYSKDSSSPELLLSITDNSGNQVTKLTGLNYITVTDGSNKSISGFDITKSSDLLTLVDNKEISASPKQIEEWNITITLVNYNYDQNANTGKNFSGKLIIQKEKMKTSLADYVISQYTGTQGENGIYYHDANLTNGAGDNSYRYAGANPNNYICFGTNENTCPTDNLYRIIGVFGDKVKLIKYDYANSNLLGTDGDYSTKTYSKSEYSTYKGELTTINRYFWNYKNNTSINDGSGSNTWSTSLFNKTNLNKNYLNNIGTTWSNLIEDTTWKVSGHTTHDVTPKVMYTAEITNATKTYGPENGTSKIGLMYVSDYGFAAAPSEWTTPLYKYNSSSASVNWMYMGLNEWTITPYSYSSNSNTLFNFSYGGSPGIYYALYEYGARPVLYLKDSVAYAGGSGTKDSPITLEV